MRIALMAVLVAVSTPGFAAQGDTKAPTVDGAGTQPTAQTTKSEVPAERKICKRIEASESRMASQRLCLTEEQWKRRQQEGSDL